MSTKLRSLLLTVLFCCAFSPSICANWQIKYLHPDGSFKALFEYSLGDPAQDIANAITESISGTQGGPYHVILGENLDANPTRQTYFVVAFAGVLIAQNILNPE